MHFSMDLRRLSIPKSHLFLFFPINRQCVTCTAEHRPPEPPQPPPLQLPDPPEPTDQSLYNWVSSILSKPFLDSSECKALVPLLSPLQFDRLFCSIRDDYLRACQIPKRKGANFRDLPGVVVGSDNVARRESTEKHSLLPSGRPLTVARLWWDETVPTVLTFPSSHNQVVLHPEQDRILTVRESARLQGFPDYYRFCGTVKERYCQIGNAVPVSVARALGYALGLAVQKLSGNDPLMTLPNKFSHSNFFQFTKKTASRDRKVMILPLTGKST